MRPHLRHVHDAGGRPSPDIVGHLTEYVVRLALRERWDMSDVQFNSERIRRMMFAEHSELIEMAWLSGLEFVAGEEGAEAAEVLLSATDIGGGYQRRVTGSTAGSSRLLVESALIGGEIGDFVIPSDFEMSTPAGSTALPSSGVFIREGRGGKNVGCLRCPLLPSPVAALANFYRLF